MPKLDEEDFVDPGNLPQIAGPKNPPPAGLSSAGGFGAPAQSYGASSYGGGFGSAPAAPAQLDRNAGGANAAQGADVLVKLDKESEDWINKKWRPVMGWVYMATCTADFVLFPILWSLLQAIQGGQVSSQWNPITLQGAGLYHIAMGAVLGIAAYGRTKEKLEQKQ
jgi:Holin of 3TMs, for gene-transfer release